MSPNFRSMLRNVPIGWNACPVGKWDPSKIDGKLKVEFERCTACGDCIQECTPDALKIFGWQSDATSIIDEVIKDKSYFDNSGGGMTLSGGDAIFQPEFALEILKLAQLNGIHTCLETAGNCKPETFVELARHTDLFLFDFKLSSDLNTKNIH